MEDKQTASMSPDVFDDPIKLLQWLSENDGMPTPESSINWDSVEATISQTKDDFNSSDSRNAFPHMGRAVSNDDRSIDCLVALRPAIKQRLKQNGIRTIEHLDSLSSEDIMRLPGFGRKKAKEIREALDICFANHDVFADKATMQNDLLPKIASTRGIDEFAIFDNYGLEYIDNRSKGGALWVVGGEEISPVLQRLKPMGMLFFFKPCGSQATKGRPAWWTKDALASTSETPTTLSQGRISVRSRRTGETTISVNDIICVRPYGEGSSVDTRDSWYICDARPMQLSSCLEGGAFAFLNDANGFSGAVRKDYVSKVSTDTDEGYDIYIEEADATIKSVGKPLNWYVDNFGIEKMIHSDDSFGLEHTEAIESQNDVVNEYSISSPELIGLLFGIVCDGVINLREAKMLRKWLDSAVVHEEGTLKIRKLLDKILDDDVISSEEEQQMLDIFNRIIELDGNFATE